MIARLHTILVLLLALCHIVRGQQSNTSRLRGAPVLAPPQGRDNHEGSSSIGLTPSLKQEDNDHQQRNLEDSCDCDYKSTGFGSGGCHIVQAAPAGKACFCYYWGLWTCYGEVYNCNNDNAEKCKNPDKSNASCYMAPRSIDPGPDSASKDRDCDGY